MADYSLGIGSDKARTFESALRAAKRKVRVHTMAVGRPAYVMAAMNYVVEGEGLGRDCRS